MDYIQEAKKVKAKREADQAAKLAAIEKNRRQCIENRHTLRQAINDRLKELARQDTRFSCKVEDNNNTYLLYFSTDNREMMVCEFAIKSLGTAPSAIIIDAKAGRTGILNNAFSVSELADLDNYIVRLVAFEI